MDVAEASTNTTNPRKYWYALKKRKNELSTICRQLKLKARDGKFYATDVVDDREIIMKGIDYSYYYETGN